jgi:hypothetical protein
MKKLIMAILGIAIFTISCNKSNELVTNPTNITGTIKTRSSSGIINFNGNDYRVDTGNHQRQRYSKKQHKQN